MTQIYNSPKRHDSNSRLIVPYIEGRSKVFEKANKIEKLDHAVRGSEKVVLGSREQVVLLAEWGEGGGGVGAVHRLPDVGRPPRPRLSTGLPGLSAGCRPAVGRPDLGARAGC